MARTDLKELLEEQIGFLERSNEAFDKGFLDEAKRIAVTLRVLLILPPFCRQREKQLYL